MRELLPEHVLQAQALLRAILIRDHLAAGLDILAIVGIPLVAVLENLPLKETRRTRRRVSVGLDRLVRPFSAQSELSPGTDVGLWAPPVGRCPLEATHAGTALRSENPVELREREVRERIGGVDEYDDTVGSAGHVESAGRDNDLGRVITVGFVKGEVLGQGWLAPIGRKIRDTGDERRNRGIAGRQVVLEADLGLDRAKGLLPPRQHATEPETEIADRAGYGLSGLVLRQSAQIVLHRGCRGSGNPRDEHAGPRTKTERNTGHRHSLVRSKRGARSFPARDYAAPLAALARVGSIPRFRNGPCRRCCSP